jgi:hypothetical protein
MKKSSLQHQSDLQLKNTVQLLNKLLLKYMSAPIALMWVHVAGSLLQDNNHGPEWVQNHMHNLGAAAMFMMFGLLRLNKMSDRYMRKTGRSSHYANTKAIMVCVLQGWTVGVIVGCGIEVLMITALRDSTIQQGYSGALDWFDISAYLVSEALIVLNYYKIAPKVLRETARSERRR